jgi:hypothetical protein
MLGLGLVSLGGSGQHTRTAPPAAPKVAAIPRGKTPAAQARNLAAWLRANSR